MGITFNVYGDSAGTERIFPFDLIPRIVRAEEWDWVERGLKQRIHALNEFIDDIYHDQKILKDKIIPRRSSIPPRFTVLNAAASILRAGSGAISPAQIWFATAMAKSTFWKTICACLPGVSYVLENRDLMKRTFPRVFAGLHVRPVDIYPSSYWRP